MKERLDLLVTSRGLARSREEAKAFIMEGIVYVNGNKEDKPGTKFDTECGIEVRGRANPYVSRGGLKLEKALESFRIDLTDCVAVDIGASTGGFTDCMLQKGAKRVYAVDVGYGQLDYLLRTDPRVVVMEKTNIRYLEPERIPEKAVFISIDVSFISLSLVLPVATALLSEEGRITALIKPQFEAGREKVGKHGVVRDPRIHREVIGKVSLLAQENGLIPADLTYSPIRGPEGNIEYLILLKKSGSDDPVTEQQITKVVATAHNELSKKTEEEERNEAFPCPDE